MNFRLFLLLVLAAVGGVAATAAAAGNDKPVESKEAPVLKKGMTAEAVMATFGKPTEVRKMNAPEGHAEAWTYRRIYRRDTTQVATRVDEVPAFVWIGGDIGSTMELSHSLQTVTIYQVTSLLMYNGEVLTAKQWLERSGGGFQ